MRPMIVIALIALFLNSSSMARGSQCAAVFSSRGLEVRRSQKLVEATSESFIVRDVLDPKIFWRAYLNEGVLSMWVQLEVPERGYRSSLKGHQIYKEMMEHFGSENIKKIESSWRDQKNFTQFFKNLKKGMSEGEAASNTWSGRQAEKYGFSRALVDVYENPLNLSHIVMVEFSRSVD